MLVYQGLCPPPCSCHLPSGLPRLPPSRPTPTFPSSLHNSSNSPAFPHPPQIPPPCPSHFALLSLAGFRALVLVRDPPSHIFRKASRRTCQAVCQLSAAWLSFSLHQPGHCSTLSDFSRVEVAENLIKSHQLLPTDYFPLQFLLLF